MMRYILLFFSVFALFAISNAQTQEVTLEPIKDNSIYQEGDLSNGVGSYLFTGVIKTGPKRRALLKFDPASVVPEGVMVDSVMVTLVPSKLKHNGEKVFLHRLLDDWGEGESNADGPEGKGADATDNDVTWTNLTKLGSLWITPGGDYLEDASVESSATLGSMTIFKSAGLTDDVNHWLTNPTEHHGWILIGDETEFLTAIRFGSRENELIDDRPKLTLYYQESTSVINPEITEQKMVVYQAGVSGEVMLRSSLDRDFYNIEVFSVTGSKVFSGLSDVNRGEQRLDMNITKSGIYVYRISNGNTSISGKLFYRAE